MKNILIYMNLHITIISIYEEVVFLPLAIYFSPFYQRYGNTCQLILFKLSVYVENDARNNWWKFGDVSDQHLTKKIHTIYVSYIFHPQDISCWNEL